MQKKLPAPVFTLLAFSAALGCSATALAQTWSAPGDGIWSVSANWSPTTVPITGNTATLGDTSSNRTVTYDSSASGTIGTLSITQSSAASNSLLVSRSLTVQNAVTLGSSGGTAQVNVGSNATSGFQLTSANGVTINPGGILGLSATTNTGGTGFNAGSTNANTALTISGGTLLVQASAGGNITAAASNTVNGSLGMTDGLIRFDNLAGSTADRRLDIRGNVNISGGAITADRTSALLQFLSSANTTITLNPTTFESTKIGLNFQSNSTQTISTNQTLGAITLRSTGVKTLTSTASSNGIGALSFWDTDNLTGGSATTLRLGSNLTLNGGANQPTFVISGGNSPESGRIDAAIDTNSFTLDLTPGATAGVWTPAAATQSGVTNNVWNLSGNGSIRANAFNFSTANVSTTIGTGLVLNAAGGNSTASNLGSAGAVNSGSIFRYSGAAATANPATLTFARNIGQVEVTSGALRILAGASGNITGISVSGGTLDLNNATRSVDTLSLSGGTLANGTYSLTSGNFTGLQTGTVSARLSGNSSLTKDSPGTLTLAGNNNFGLGGSFTLNQGTLVAGHVNALGSVAVVVVNGGDLDFGGLPINKVFNLGPNGGTLSNGTIARNTANNANLNIQAGTLAVGITESGGGIVSINKNGNGTATVSGNNTHTGTTTISDGTLIVTNSNALGAGAVTLSGGALNLGGSNSTLSLTVGAASGLNVTGGSLLFDLGTSFDQIVGNGGSVSITGGTLVLNITGAGFNFGTSYQILSGFSSVSVSGLSYLASNGGGAPVTFESLGYTAALSSTGLLSITLTAPADTTPPVITLNGPSSVSVPWGSSYTDAGATATDETAPANPTVSITGSVNTSKPGVYTLLYNATDAASNPAQTVQRTVTVSITNATTPGADGLTPLMRYAFGATGPTDAVQLPSTSATSTSLSITAVTRNDDAAVVVTGETNTDLTIPANWTTSGVTETVAPDQSGVPAGCTRKIFTVDLTGSSRKFLRLKVTSGL